MSYNTILFSFYEKTAEDGLASRGRNLSLPNIGARLFEASADFPDGTDLWTGRYSAAANAVFVSNGFTTQSAAGVLDEQHTQSSGAGPLSGVVDAPPTVIPVNFAAAGIPIADGAPVILSPVPCKGGLGQCLGPVATGAGDPTTRPTGELTNGGSLPLTEPLGGRPATPPAPGGGASWDPGHGGIGTVISTPAGSITPKPDTGECPPV